MLAWAVAGTATVGAHYLEYVANNALAVILALAGPCLGFAAGGALSARARLRECHGAFSHVHAGLVWLGCTAMVLAAKTLLAKQNAGETTTAFDVIVESDTLVFLVAVVALGALGFAATAAMCVSGGHRRPWRAVVVAGFAGAVGALLGLYAYVVLFYLTVDLFERVAFGFPYVPPALAGILGGVIAGGVAGFVGELSLPEAAVASTSTRLDARF